MYINLTMLVVAGGMVVVSRNAVHSVLYLVIVFVNASVVLVGMGVEYLAMVFLVVYVGAVSVLFLFVVMMLKVEEVEGVRVPVGIVGLMVGLVFLGLGMEVLERYGEIIELEGLVTD